MQSAEKNMLEEEARQKTCALIPNKKLREIERANISSMFLMYIAIKWNLHYIGDVLQDKMMNKGNIQMKGHRKIAESKRKRRRLSVLG